MAGDGPGAEEEPGGELRGERLVRQGRGVSGANPDYVRSTHEHLLGMGIVDPLLERITASLS